MNRYRILRENEQHGPFTLEAIHLFQLRASDRVWVEGASTSWTDPADLPELSGLMGESGQSGAEQEKRIPSIVTITLPCSDRNSTSEREKEHQDASDGWRDRYRHNLETKRERTASGLARSRVVLLSFFAGALLLFALSLHSFLDPLDRINGYGKPKHVLETITEEQDYQTALQFETIPKPDSLVEMKLSKVVRPESLRKMVLVKGSRYDVDLPRGSRNLQLTLSNKSAHMIDKATIAVDYLRSNGSLIWSERFTVQHLKGNASRTVDVPSFRNGVKMRYRVTDVQSGTYSDELRQL